MTDYSKYHDAYAHPYQYQFKDIQPDIRDADELSWRQKRIAQTIRDQMAFEKGLALAREVLMYHQHYQDITAKMSVEEHMRFDLHLLTASRALEVMADAWLFNETKENEDEE